MQMTGTLSCLPTPPALVPACKLPPHPADVLACLPSFRQSLTQGCCCLDSGLVCAGLGVPFSGVCPYLPQVGQWMEEGGMARVSVQLRLLGSSHMPFMASGSFVFLFLYCAVSISSWGLGCIWLCSQ